MCLLASFRGDAGGGRSAKQMRCGVRRNAPSHRPSAAGSRGRRPAGYFAWGCFRYFGSRKRPMWQVGVHRRNICGVEGAAPPPTRRFAPPSPPLASLGRERKERSDLHRRQLGHATIGSRQRPPLSLPQPLNARQHRTRSPQWHQRRSSAQKACFQSRRDLGASARIEQRAASDRGGFGGTLARSAL